MEIDWGYDPQPDLLLASIKVVFIIPCTVELGAWQMCLPGLLQLLLSMRMILLMSERTQNSGKDVCEHFLK